MDGLTLLNEARAASLAVRADGGRLVIRGPRMAEALACRLLAHKAAVLAVLADRVTEAPAVRAAAGDNLECVPWEQCPLADFTCPKCGCIACWWNPWGDPHCQRCEPPAAALGFLEGVQRVRGRVGLPTSAHAEALRRGLRDVCRHIA